MNLWVLSIWVEKSGVINKKPVPLNWNLCFTGKIENWSKVAGTEKLVVIKKRPSSRAWWHMPLIPALGRQRQADFWVWGQPGLQSEFQDSQGYTEKPCLEKQTNKTPANLFLLLRKRIKLRLDDWQGVKKKMNCHLGTFTGDKLEEKLASNGEKEMRPVCTAFFWRPSGSIWGLPLWLELHKEAWARLEWQPTL